jgi:hypothetical protein
MFATVRQHRATDKRTFEYGLVIKNLQKNSDEGMYDCQVWARSLICNKKTKQLFSLRDTAMWLRSQRPLHVQGDAGHPIYQGGGPQKRIIRKNGGPRRRRGIKMTVGYCVNLIITNNSVLK